MNLTNYLLYDLYIYIYISDDYIIHVCVWQWLEKLESGEKFLGKVAKTCPRVRFSAPST